MRRQKQEIMAMRDSRKACEGANPGRSLVPAAQAQAARSRYAAFPPTLIPNIIPFSEFSVGSG
jgi:hypothetical protein